MILIPIFILLALEGVINLVDLCKRRFSVKLLTALPVALALTFLTAFTFSYPQMIDERRDPLDETQLVNLFKEYKVGVVYQVPNLLNLAYMKDLSHHFPIVTGIWLENNFKPPSYNLDTLAFVSQLTDLDEECFDFFVKRFNETSGLPPIHATLSDYTVVYSKVSIGPMMDYTHYSNQQRNSLRVYILSKNPLK